MIRSAVWCSVLLVFCDVVSDDREIGFNREIRPILSENCYACHGPDANAREAGLRLDLEEAATAELDSGARAIVPGQPEASELVARVTTDDADSVMPPAETGKTLTKREIELLRKWVEQGAKWEKHWSLIPIQRPKIPDVAEPGATLHPIDAFVLAGLRANGLSPSAPADQRTLIRRLSFDLTGLPPSPDEVERFEQSTDPKAYEALVDSLLASPHFGERMAVAWLDLVRYADSVGYHGDQPISVSPYRDYVIRAFDANKPFDAFTVEQLAGDLLESLSLEQKIASGYNRLGMMSAEGGIQDKEYRAKYAAERVRNLGGTWLGLTLGCCECHDHKYDPLSTREFYSLEAFFADIQEKGFYDGGFQRNDWGPSILVPTPQEQSQLDAMDKEIVSIKEELGRRTPALEAEQLVWEESVAGTKNWVPLAPLTAVAKSGSKLKVLEDHSILASGTAPESERYTVTARVPIAGVTAFRVEALPDESLPNRGPGRASNGNFVLTGFSVDYHRAPQGKAQPVTLDRGTATVEQTVEAKDAPFPALSAASVLAEAKEKAWGWAIMPETGQPQHAVFETVLDITAEADAVLAVTLEHAFENPQHVLGRFRISVTNDPRPVQAEGAGVPRAIAGILKTPRNDRTAEQQTGVADYFQSVAPSLAPLRQRLAEAERKREAFEKSIATSPITVAVAPREIRVLPRGNWMDDSGPVVAPAIPAVLPQPATTKDRMTRLDLARWLVSRDHPLTARVFVNRLWKILFGDGLSRKLDDLGSQGDWPSHPELLDWLASEFIDSGWDVKRTIRLIVLSNTYRQSSIPSAEMMEVDPYNRWLARQGRFRLDAEFVRDNALATSGLLVRTIGGRSVKPYQPPGYWAFLNFPMREWKDGKDDELYRRGLYTHWQRQYLHPSLLAFDAPSREECTAERVRSSTPLQSLVLLNDPSYVEAARVLAERVLKEGGSNDEDRLHWVFREALSRPIEPKEQTILAELLAKHRAEYLSDPAAAAALLAVGEKAVDSKAEPQELAAWVSVARTILNLHAFVMRN